MLYKYKLKNKLFLKKSLKIEVNVTMNVKEYDKLNKKLNKYIKNNNEKETEKLLKLNDFYVLKYGYTSSVLSAIKSHNIEMIYLLLDYGIRNIEDVYEIINIAFNMGATETVLSIILYMKLDLEGEDFELVKKLIFIPQIQNTKLLYYILSLDLDFNNIKFESYGDEKLGLLNFYMTGEKEPNYDIASEILETLLNGGIVDPVKHKGLIGSAGIYGNTKIILKLLKIKGMKITREDIENTIKYGGNYKTIKLLFDKSNIDIDRKLLLLAVKYKSEGLKYLLENGNFETSKSNNDLKQTIDTEITNIVFIGEFSTDYYTVVTLFEFGLIDPLYDNLYPISWLILHKKIDILRNILKYVDLKKHIDNYVFLISAIKNEDMEMIKLLIEHIKIYNEESFIKIFDALLLNNNNNSVLMTEIIIERYHKILFMKYLKLFLDEKYLKTFKELLKYIYDEKTKKYIPGLIITITKNLLQYIIKNIDLTKRLIPVLIMTSISKKDLDSLRKLLRNENFIESYLKQYSNYFTNIVKLGMKFVKMIESKVSVTEESYKKALEYVKDIETFNHVVYKLKILHPLSTFPDNKHLKKYINSDKFEIFKYILDRNLITPGKLLLFVENSSVKYILEKTKYFNLLLKVDNIKLNPITFRLIFEYFEEGNELKDKEHIDFIYNLLTSKIVLDNKKKFNDVLSDNTEFIINFTELLKEENLENILKSYTEFIASKYIDKYIQDLDYEYNFSVLLNHLFGNYYDNLNKYFTKIEIKKLYYEYGNILVHLEDKNEEEKALTLEYYYKADDYENANSRYESLMSEYSGVNLNNLDFEVNIDSITVLKLLKLLGKK